MEFGLFLVLYMHALSIGGGTKLLAKLNNAKESADELFHFLSLNISNVNCLLKKLVLFAAVLMVSLFSIDDAKAQINLNINISQQPVWGPTGYDHVDYYYLPDIETYYYVPQHQFIYLDAGRWVFAASLPARCSGYDLYRGYKVVINDPRPWMRHDVYRARYVQYRNCNDRQPVLRDRRHRDDDDQGDDGPGHGRGRGHAYGHYKNHDKHHGDDEDH